MLSLLPQCLQTPSRLSHLLNVNLLSLEQDASGRTARSGVPLRDARSLCHPYQSLLLTCGQKNTHSRVWQCSTCSSLQQGADLGPAAVAAEVFLLHWVSVFFHSLIESLFGGSHVVASSQCMFSLSVWKLACFMLPNWTDWYPWSVTFAWWQYRPWIITWKKGQCAMITNSKNSVKAFLDPGIHLNVTLAQELICLGEWLSTLSHSKSAALH